MRKFISYFLSIFIALPIIIVVCNHFNSYLPIGLLFILWALIEFGIIGELIDLVLKRISKKKKSS